jgi:hypothetical protein
MKTNMKLTEMLLLGFVLPWACSSFGLFSEPRSTSSTKLYSLSSLQLQEQVLLASSQEALKSATMAKQVRDWREARRGLVLALPQQKTSVAEKEQETSKRRQSIPSTTNHETSLRVKSRNSLATATTTMFTYISALTALKAFHKQHGHLVLPRRFVVPSSAEYPSEWHGVDLASHVYQMRWWQLHVKQHPDRVSELNRLGFCWERLQPEWNLVLQALVAYQGLYGDLLVPVAFVVPSGDDAWPAATWGIRLGRAVYRIRHRLDFLRGPKGATRKGQLEGLGFCWDVRDQAFDVLVEALQHYASLHPDKRPFSVPSTFVVPRHHSWPVTLWDYPLGAKCTAIRQKGLYVKGQPQRQLLLTEIGFSWHGNASLAWLQVVHAAAIYSQLHHGNLHVPVTFQVPSPSKDTPDAWPWPEQLWGFPLGQRLKDLRTKGAYLKGPNAAKRRAQLDALGFEWNPKRGRRRATSHK